MGRSKEIQSDAVKSRRTMRRKWLEYSQRAEHAWRRYHKVDRAKNRECDLTLEFVRTEIEKPCSYCGNTQGLICLDRKDSAIGHTMDNVVPSCERCNLIKKDMPFEAWAEIASSVRAASEKGLFGDWVGGPHAKRRKELPPQPFQVKEKNTYPSTDELREQLKLEPATVVAKRIGVPVESLRSHCVRVGLPLYGRGYWQQVKAGKEPLPSESKTSSAPKNTNYPPPADLTTLLQSKPATEIAKDLGVTSTALKKHCNKVGVVTPSRGFWRAKWAAEKVKEDLRCKGCSKPISKTSKTFQCSMCFNKSPEKREATRQQKLKFPTLPVDTERSRE